jgi:hypothetical protein
MCERSFGANGEHGLLTEESATEPRLTLLAAGENERMVTERDGRVEGVLRRTESDPRSSNSVWRWAADADRTVLQYGVRAFADALEEAPQPFAANSTDAPIQTAETGEIQRSKAPIDFNDRFFAVNDTKEQRVIGLLDGKAPRFRRATQIAKMVLRSTISSET